MLRTGFGCSEPVSDGQNRCRACLGPHIPPTTGFGFRSGAFPVWCISGFGFVCNRGVLELVWVEPRAGLVHFRFCVQGGGVQNRFGTAQNRFGAGFGRFRFWFPVWVQNRFCAAPKPLWGISGFVCNIYTLYLNLIVMYLTSRACVRACVRARARARARVCV